MGCDAASGASLGETALSADLGGSRMKTLKAEVEKGFMRTVGHGLVDPKSQGNPDRMFGERESG